MPRVSLNQSLASADAIIARYELVMARQQELSARLKREGRDCAVAATLLAILEKTQAGYIAERDMLLDQGSE